MQIELKRFQIEAARMVLDELDESREAARKGKVQAVVLSAPTGSGKTITLASVIDQTFGGGDGVLARPDTTFLWLSDSPELNAQSKAKLINACDNLPFHKIVTIEADSFDEERLYPSYLYFINIQLLGRDKRLTQSGDNRQFTFWNTVANTIGHGPDRFVLVIDEAHRGATIQNRGTIMQKFIHGSEADGLPPVPVVLGMSATPQRFTQLLGNTNRTQRPINITPEDVRSSGLLKDIIVVHSPQAAAVSDLTLLEQAAARTNEFAKLWEAYCHQEREDRVRPILVVQVEDGTEAIVSRTSLSDVVRVIERRLGPLALNEVVHCFQDRPELEVGGRIIRKMDASRIQDSPDVKVVLFKTALTTGWDCPRAEVMMSFRRAQEPSTIAQLVGRMIRTPLARRIRRVEMLDTVELFLPHYDSEALESVLTHLRNPEAEEGPGTRVETSVRQYGRNSRHAEVFEVLQRLPTYAVKRAPRMGDIKRVLRLAGMLVHDGLDKDADEETREVLTGKLKQLRDELATSDSDWSNIVRDGGEIEVDVNMVAVAGMTVVGKKEVRMPLSDENIDMLFEAVGRKLAAGEGLHRSYWKRFHDTSKPSQAKLELFAVVRRARSLQILEELAQDQFTTLWNKNKSVIHILPAAEKAKFGALMQASATPVQEEWDLPEEIVEKQSGDLWKEHLFCDSDGGFFAKLNNWEKPILEQTMSEDGFVCWLRNLERRDWAFCIPYELGGTRAFYPDFVAVRREGGVYIVDLLEPHDSSRADTWAKAKGLAEFADKHGMEFGRLVIARKEGDHFETIDLNNKDIRKAARAMQSQNDLEGLFRI